MAGSGGEAKRLMEGLQTELRGLSNEARKKYPAVREAAEAALTKLKNVCAGAGTEDEAQAALRAASAELLHPFLLACGSRQAALARLGLSSVQRLVQQRALQTASAPVLVKELWALADADVEELKVLQTIQLLVSTPGLVEGESLARCLVLCLRLRMAKDPVVINTASASVRQLVGQVFERVVQEEGRDAAQAASPADLSVHPHPDSLAPGARDAYALFQDLCLLVGGEPAQWLQGVKGMDRALGLELLESVLVSHTALFSRRGELCWLLKESVCPLVIKLFSPSLKNSGSSPERPSFPLLLRLLRLVSCLVTLYFSLLVTECEIFLSLIVKFLEGEKREWQRALALEVLHKVAACPDLLRSIAASYDLKPHATNVLQDILNSLGSFVQTTLTKAASSPARREEEEGGQGSGRDGAPGFALRRAWLPLAFIAPQGTPRALFLELLDKHDPPPVPNGYCVSLSFSALTDAAHSIATAASTRGPSEEATSQLSGQLLRSSHAGLLGSLALLLDASTDDAINERCLKSLSLLVTLACDLSESGIREGALGALCRAALPPQYLARVIPPASLPNGRPVWEREAEGPGAAPANVVATGTPCPTPWLPAELSGKQVVLTAKNLQAMRSLLSTAQLNGPGLLESWHLVLATLQHLAWMLGLRPAMAGGWEAARAGSAGDSVLTNAAAADLPVLGALLNKLFDLSKDLDEVGLHHVIGSLVKLSGDALLVASRMEGRGEPSFLPAAKLRHVGLVNLHRLPAFWKPLNGHLRELCSGPSAALREWGSGGTVALVKAAFAESPTPDGWTRERLELLALQPLVELCEVAAEDVRKAQIHCLLGLLRGRSSQLSGGVWPAMIGVLADVPAPHNSFGEEVVKAGFGAVAFLTNDCLPCLPDLESLRQLIEVVAKFGGQQAELNSSLSAVGQLWTVSDFLYRSQAKMAQGADEARSGSLEKLWLCVYTALSDLCVDGRPAVRKSACQTLLQTAASHGSSLLPHTWQLMLWNVLYPMMERVRAVHAGASTEKCPSGKGGGGALLIHHSRDTEAKQWAETASATLAALVRIFNAQRPLLLALPDFHKAWAALLGYLKAAAASTSVEVRLQGLRSLLELLVGRGAASGASAEETKAPLPPLPQEAWLAAWSVWLEVGEALAGLEGSTPPSPSPAGPITKEPMGIPGSTISGKPAHLTAFLRIFPPIFAQVSEQISSEDWVRWARVLEGVVSLPVATEDAPYILPTQAEVTPTQDQVLVAVKLAYDQAAQSSSPLRKVLPHILELLMRFGALTVRGPSSLRRRSSVGGEAPSGAWLARNFVPFAELSLRRLVEFYSSTAAAAEVVEAGTLAALVRCLGLPMAAKYACPAQSSWKLAAASFLTVAQIGLPIARQHPRHFKTLWAEMGSALEGFLFPSVGPPESLGHDELRRHELLDCQLVELVRAQLLPHAHSLPPTFLTRLIDILNRGSLALPPGQGSAEGGGGRDALELGGWSGRQRSELSRVCFEALLAMSAGGERPDVVRGTSGGGAGAHGTEAVLSLLGRAAAVLGSHAREEPLRGAALPLSKVPASRESEVESVLGAVGTLLESLRKSPSPAEPDVWDALIRLYPLLVDVVPTQNEAIRGALMRALKAYQPLLAPPRAD